MRDFLYALIHLYRGSLSNRHSLGNGFNNFNSAEKGISLHPDGEWSLLGFRKYVQNSGKKKKNLKFTQMCKRQ